VETEFLLQLLAQRPIGVAVLVVEVIILVEILDLAVAVLAVVA
jgi:hypothetical protein